MAVAVPGADTPPENIQDVPHAAVDSYFEVPFEQIVTVVPFVVSVFFLT